MLTPRRTAIRQSSKRCRKPAVSRESIFFPWSAAPTTTRCSSPALLRLQCCSFLVATAIVTGLTNTRIQATSLAALSSLPRRWQRSPVKTPCAESFGAKRFADFRVARLDSGINEIDTLFVGQKSAFHRVDCDLLKISQRQSEGVGGSFKFLGHRGVAH